jgi:hypothetical protein
MSYAIIRNAKYKIANLPSVSRHNERQNEEYGNKDIDKTRTSDNYHLRAPIERSYEKEFDRLRIDNDLKGNLRLTGKKQSNVACEFLITSDVDYFHDIGADETRRFFQIAYEYAHRKVGERNILSAVVHMDETTPHMHLTYIPVVKGVKKGVEIDKINCSEFWKGFNSYGVLQDDFHAFITSRGFDLERGVKNESREEKREHLSVEEYKLETTLQEALDARKTLNKALDDIKHAEGHKKGLEREIGALRTKKDTLTTAEVNAIKGTRNIFGGLRGVSYSEYEALKRTATQARRMERERERAISRAETAEKNVADIKVAAQKRIMEIRAVAEADTPSLRQRMEYKALQARFDRVTKWLNQLLYILPERVKGFIRDILDDRDPFTRGRDMIRDRDRER